MPASYLRKLVRPVPAFQVGLEEACQRHTRQPGKVAGQSPNRRAQAEIHGNYPHLHRPTLRNTVRMSYNALFDAFMIEPARPRDFVQIFTGPLGMATITPSQEIVYVA